VKGKKVARSIGTLVLGSVAWAALSGFQDPVPQVPLPGTPQLPQMPPKAPPPRVQDLAVPPNITLPSANNPDPSVANAPLTADEAARIALKLQPTIAGAIGAIETQKGRTRQIGSAMNPQFILGAGYNSVSSLSGNGVAVPQAPNGTTVPGVSPVFTYSGVAEIRQLLYDFNQTRNLVRQSESLEDVAKLTLTRTQLDLVQAVKSAYYAYLSSERLVRVNEQNVANRQRQLDLANARLRYEIGLPSDVVTAETSKVQGILALNIARDAASQARVNLLLQIGVDPLTPINVSDMAEATLPDNDVKSLTVDALKSRPEIQAAQRSLVASRYGLDAAKSLNMPSIYASVSAGLAGNQFPLKDNAAALGFGFQFPLGDGGQRAGAVQSAKGQITTAQASLQSTVLSIQNDVTASFLELQSAAQRVSIADAEVANAREGVRVSEGRYSAGLGTFLDITNAQALLLGALTDQETVTNALNQARTRLRHAIGQML